MVHGYRRKGKTRLFFDLLFHCRDSCDSGQHYLIQEIIWRSPMERILDYSSEQAGVHYG